ncbi:hypothetical protein IG631_04525 [Alternaria alternata]|nr:hypothetical protein IG631_04525 [Alternaria alternata]
MRCKVEGAEVDASDYRIDGHQYRRAVHGAIVDCSQYEATLWKQARTHICKRTNIMHFATLFSSILAAYSFYASALPIEPKRGQ